MRSLFWIAIGLLVVFGMILFDVLSLPKCQPDEVLARGFGYPLYVCVKGHK